MSNLWKDIEPYIELLVKDSENNLFGDSYEIRDGLASRRRGRRARRPDVPGATPPSLSVPESESVNESAASIETQEEKQSGPRIPRGEVEELKLRYIVGKVAGRDVLDRHGNVLIKRGETLTANNVLLAEQAGRLVELIVHMVIQDLGD